MKADLGAAICTAESRAQDDRELLMSAAKSAGMALGYEPGQWFADIREPCMGLWEIASLQAASGRVWNPLTDDGDALRLAVKLGMYVECNRGDTEVRCALNDGNFYITQRFNGDPLAATRRAIVRVAAALASERFSAVTKSDPK